MKKKIVLVMLVFLSSIFLFSCEKADRGEIIGTYFQNNLEMTRYTFYEDGLIQYDDKNGEYESLGNHRYILKLGKKEYLVEVKEDKIKEKNGKLRLFSSRDDAIHSYEKILSDVKELSGKYIANVNGSKIEMIFDNNNLHLKSVKGKDILEADYTIKMVEKNKFQIIDGKELVEEAEYILKNDELILKGKDKEIIYKKIK